MDGRGAGLVLDAEKLPACVRLGLKRLDHRAEQLCAELRLALDGEVPCFDPGDVEQVVEQLRCLLGRALNGHGMRSEEHTSELQSLRHLVCRLLLEKKKKIARR